MMIAKRRAFGTGDEPLAAADDVVVAFPARRRRQHRRVGPGARRGLGHAEAGADLARRQRPQPALLVCGLRDRFEQMHVAFVRRKNVERNRTERRVARLFEGNRPAEVRQRQAAVLARHVRGQQVRAAAPWRSALAASASVGPCGVQRASLSSGMTCSATKVRIRSCRSLSSGATSKSTGMSVMELRYCQEHARSNLRRRAHHRSRVCGARRSVRRAAGTVPIRYRRTPFRPAPADGCRSGR